MLFRDLAMLGDAACAIELTWPLSSRDAPGALSEPIRPKSFLQLPLGALGQLSAQDVYGQQSIFSVLQRCSLFYHIR
jgi:hypothetical protein